MRYCQEKGIVCQYAGTNMHCRLTACIFPKENLYPTASKGGHLMNVKKLIERLKCPQMCNCPMDGEYPSCWACQKDIKRQAATAMETLQAENEKLRTEKVKVIGNDELMDELQAVLAENEKLRAEAEGMRSNWYKAVEEIKNLRTELDEKEKYYDQMIDALSATDNTELERVKRERDAAVADLKKWKICATCKNYQPHGKSTNCKIKSAYLSGGNWAGCSKWEWRGPKED